MVFESMSKKDLVKDCKEKETNLQKKDEAFQDLRKLKDEDIRKKDEDIRKKDEDIRKKDEDIRKKDEDIRKKDEAFMNLLLLKDKAFQELRQLKDEDIRMKDYDLEEKRKIIGEREGSIEQYKKTTSEREINHFLSIIHEYQEHESEVLDQANGSIEDYNSFFQYCFHIGNYKAIFKGKALLWKLGDYVAEMKEAPIVTEFFCKLPTKYIGYIDNTRVILRQLSSREFQFDLQDIIDFDWMHKITPKIKACTNQAFLLQCVLTIHSSPHDVIKEAGNICEAICSQIFFGTLLNEIKHFLGELNKKLELKITQEEKINHGKPDGILYDKEKACLVFEMKCMEWFQERTGTGNFGTRLNGDIIQLINYMIEKGCSRGILSDSFRYILIEMDFSDEQDHTNRIQLKYKYVDANSMKPSLLEVLLGFIQESIDDEECGKKVNKLKSKFPVKEKRPHSSRETSPAKRPKRTIMDLFRFGKEWVEGSSSQEEESSSSRPTTAESYQDFAKSIANAFNTKLTSVVEEPIVKIQYGSRNKLFGEEYTDTKILKIEAKHFQQILETNIDPEETIIVKIYNRNGHNDEEINETYTRERACINRMSKDPEYHNCYLQHSEATVLATPNEWGYDIYKGKVILSKYIEGQEYLNRKRISRTELETQLEVIHRNGILHNDIMEFNILNDEEKRVVYIMDFSLASFREEEKEEEEIERKMNRDRERLRILCDNYEWK